MRRIARTDVRVVCWLAAIAILLGALMLWNNNAQAQNAADNIQPEAETDDANDDKKKDASATSWENSFGGMIVKGGWVGVPFYIFLAILSIIALTFALERLFRLVSSRILPERFVGGLRELIGRGEENPDVYRELCDSTPSQSATILRAGLARTGRPPTEVEKAMEDATAREMSELRGRHRPLQVIGSIAPLVGLLGTVVGMILAFYQSSRSEVFEQSQTSRADVLSEYIYLALITTAWGLVIAIPSLLAAAWCSARVERFTRQIDVELGEMIPVFIKLEKRQPAVAASAPIQSEVVAAARAENVEDEEFATVGEN